MTALLNGPNSQPVDHVEQKCVETYEDEVTPQMLALMNEEVSDNEFVGYEVLDGPAW